MPHPSEIPKEFEVPQVKRLMTPERKTYRGNQRVERRSSREPARRSEPLQPIPEQEVIQPSPRRIATATREDSAPPPPKRPPPVCPMNEAERTALVAETLERARRVEAKSPGGAA